jgi:methionyl-tRNA formyltransferase
MIRYENQCLACAAPLYPCMGSSCPNRHVKIYECDCCGEELEPGELFEFDGEELCIDCIKERLDIVE